MRGSIVSDSVKQPSILIVEDDPLIALDLEIAFQDAGYTVIGPARNVKAAMAMLDSADVQMACLDYNLGDETSMPIAERLESEGVPFVFATGLSSELTQAPHLPEARILSKPVQPATVMQALAA